ncbi:hypothetical protein C3M82_000009 [Salmonella enterica subsp. enterica serovar Minnesota]|nr:hypothetical protein [Salmonella enterica subsp. enterica serovar Minnesota]
MKEVKIYTIVSDQLSPPITGESFCTDMVRHSDYAELEDKYAALAADNDKAMESLKQADAVVKLAHEKFSALAAENAGLKELIEQHANSVAVCPNCSHEEPSETDDIVALYRSMETPATDVFLAEVRAQGVEMAMDHMQSSGALTFGDCYISLNKFAAQLRKERGL